MWGHMLQKLICAAVLLTYLSTGEAAKLTRQQAINEWTTETGNPDPFPKIARALGEEAKGKIVSAFDRYLQSATDEKGTVKTGSADVLKVLGVVGTSTTKLKSKEPLKVLSGLLDIGTVIAGLVPGGEPFAVVFTAISLGLGFADKPEDASDKMKKVIETALWVNTLQVSKDKVNTFLTENSIRIKALNLKIKRENDQEEAFTVTALRDNMGKSGLLTYGSDELQALWTVVKRSIDLPDQEKTPDHGLKVYNMILLYVQAAILRDTALTQFKVASEMAFKRKCSEWEDKDSCEELSKNDKKRLRGWRNNVRDRMELNKDLYCEVGEFLEQVLLKRSPVVLHHHPIGWNEESQFIHDFAMKYPHPSSSSYQSSWTEKETKKYVMQPGNWWSRHIESEFRTGSNDYFQLESSDCKNNFEVHFTKISDPTNKERHGYFKLKSNEYDGSDASNWKTLRYWRFYKGSGTKWWLRLDLASSVSEIDTVIKSNQTGLADEYLFIVLEQEVNDEIRCKDGVKPKVVIIPKLARKKKVGLGMFLAYSDFGLHYQVVESATYKDDKDTSSWSAEWLLHDCQGQTSCPGCHSKEHRLNQGPQTVDGRGCPRSTIFDPFFD